MTKVDLPPAELDVMNCIWQRDETATAIRESLAQTRPLSHSSVCTLLKRLEEKGMIERSKGTKGKAFVYRPLVAKAGTKRSMLTRLLDRLFGGNGVALVASLLESRPPTDTEIDELEKLIKELKAERRNKNTKSQRKRSN